MSYDWYDEMERAEQEYDAKENEMAQEYKRGYEQGRTDYEAECQKIFEDNPPMHFNHEQIMWLKEFVKIRCNQARADAIDEFVEHITLPLTEEDIERIATELKEKNNE